MIHLDLFSGIGGFALAVDEVSPGAEHIFCEIDPYCQTLLKKRFKEARIYGDIRTLSRERLIADTNTMRLQESRAELEAGRDRSDAKVDLLTGGFPCQPFSQAGKRKGTDDNRYLWPEMLRVIREFKPTWVIAENVRGLLTINEGMVFEQVCLDLEGEGYEVQSFIIPAVAVNAPHRRDRVWFVANRKQSDKDSISIRSRGRGEDGRQVLECGRTEAEATGSDCEGWDAFDTKSTRLQDRDAGAVPRPEQNEECERSVGGCFAPEQWNQNWLEVATELCGVDDGLPAELDGLKLSKSKHRVERLKALGNAVVPDVVVKILEAIKLAEEMEVMFK